MQTGFPFVCYVREHSLVGSTPEGISPGNHDRHRISHSGVRVEYFMKVRCDFLGVGIFWRSRTLKRWRSLEGSFERFDSSEDVELHHWLRQKARKTCMCTNVSF